MRTGKNIPQILFLFCIIVIVFTVKGFFSPATGNMYTAGELEKAVESYPTNVKNFYTLGVLYRLDRRYHEAETIFNKALAIPSLSAEWKSILYRQLAELYIASGDYDKVLANIRQAVTIYPGSAELTGKILVNFYKKQDLYDQTIINFENEVSTGTKDPLPYYFLVKVYRGQLPDSFEKLVAIWQNLISLQPTSPDHYRDLAGLYYRFKEYDKAIETTKKRIEIVAGQTQELQDAYTYLAYLYETKGMNKESTDAARRAIELDPESNRAQYARKILRRLGANKTLEPLPLAKDKSESAQLRLKQLDMAIRMYLQEHNKLPEKLGDLVPNYITVLYKDPFNPEHTYQYEVSGTKWVIWSYGPDRINDDHDKARDIVISSQ